MDNLMNLSLENSLNQLKTVAKKVNKKLENRQVTKWCLLTSVVGSGLLYCRDAANSAYHRYKCLPPALSGVPVLGSIATMLYYNKDFQLEILPKLGPICSYYLGNQLIININNRKIVETIFKHKCCINRPAAYGKPRYKGHLLFFAFINKDNHWHLRRKLIINAVIALSKRSSMDKITKYLFTNLMFTQIEPHCTGPECIVGTESTVRTSAHAHAWFPRADLRNASFNMVFGSLFGYNKQLHKDDDRYISYDKAMQFAVKYGSLFTMFDSVPVLDTVSTMDNIITNEIIEIVAKPFRVTNGIIEDFVKIAISEFDINKFNSNEEGRTLFDELYHQIIKDKQGSDDSNGNNNGKNNKYGFYLSKDDSDMKLLCADIMALIAGAIDTTAHALETAILYLAKYPGLQDEIYEQLSQFKNEYIWEKGDSKKSCINVSDTVKCVKFRAFVHEIIRISNGLPNGIPRALTKDCKLSFDVDTNGECVDIEFKECDKDGSGPSGKEVNSSSEKEFNYIIPKTAFIQANIDYINNHSNGNSLELNINNWIGKTQDNKLKFVNNSYFIPFSIGVRDCPGKSLSQSQLYSFLANLIINYKFSNNYYDTNANASNQDIEFAVEFSKRVYPQMAVFVEKRN